MGSSQPAEVQAKTAKSILGQYRAQAMTARRLKSQEGWWRQVLLIGSIAALLATPFAKTFERLDMPTVGKALVIVSTVLFALLAWLNREVLGDDSQRPWVRARQTGEGLKSLAYRYLGGVAPFDGANGADLALKRAGELIAKTGVSADRVSDEEKAKRLPPAPLGPSDYIAERVDDQLKWYEKAAEDERKTEDRIKHIGWAISAGVVVFGAIGAVVGKEWRDIWAPALGVAATMITTQMSRARHRFLAETYSSAAVKLDLVRTTWDISPKAVADTDSLFATVETILSDENAGWVQQMLIKPVVPDPAPPSATKA